MAHPRVLVTGATGRIGGAVAGQLLRQGIATRALVHRDDERSARLRAAGAEVVVGDMFDIRQIQAAMDGAPDDATGPLLEPVIRPLYRAYESLTRARSARVRDGVRNASGQILTAPSADRSAQWEKSVAPIDAAYVASVPNGQAILDQYRQLLAAAKTK